MKRTYPVRNPDIVARKEEKEALLFNPNDGEILCINGTGILIWDLCDGSCAIEDIAGQITDKYEVPAEKAKEDCLDFLKKLEEPGFIGYKA
ncbi:MAG: PqqD family protein [Candidatus Omnitrophota bacterium]